MNKKKILIVTVIVVLIIAAYYYFKKPKTTGTDTEKDKSLDKHFNVQVPDTRHDSFPLNTNSKGERVNTLQLAVNRLIDKYNANSIYSAPGTTVVKEPALIVDGVLGTKTKDAIIKVVGVAFYGPTGINETQFNSIIEKSNK